MSYQGRTQDFFKGDVLQIDAGRDAAPALKKIAQWVGEGELWCLLFTPQKENGKDSILGVYGYLRTWSALWQGREWNKNKKKRTESMPGGGCLNPPNTSPCQPYAPPPLRCLGWYSEHSFIFPFIFSFKSVR